MANTATFTIEDYDNEKSSMTINVGLLTVLNFLSKRDAVNLLQQAMEDMIIGEIRKTSINENFTVSVNPVTDRNAQRERKWLITMRDTQQFFDVLNTLPNPQFGNLFQVELATADLSLLPAFATDRVDLTIPAIANFVTRLEGIAHAPAGGGNPEVVSIRHVGRNI